MSLWQVVSGNNGEWCVESGKSFYLIAFNSQWLQHSLVRIWPQYTQKFNFYLLRQVMTGYTHTPTQPHLIIILFKCLLCCCCRFLWHSTGLCLLLTLLIQVKQSDVYIVYQSYAPLSTHTQTNYAHTHTVCLPPDVTQYLMLLYACCKACHPSLCIPCTAEIIVLPR